MHQCGTTITEGSRVRTSHRLRDLAGNARQTQMEPLGESATAGNEDSVIAQSHRRVAHLYRPVAIRRRENKARPDRTPPHSKACAIARIGSSERGRAVAQPRGCFCGATTRGGACAELALRGVIISGTRVDDVVSINRDVHR